MSPRLLVFLALASAAWATNFTSTASGNLSAGSTWVGGVAPSCAGGDTITVATGHTVTVDVNCTLGSKSAAVGDAFTIQATNSSTFGQLAVSNGITLTLRGNDKTTNRAGKINQFGLFAPASGSTIKVDAASDFQTIIKNDGRFEVNGATFTIPSANITWSNASGSRTLSGISQIRWDANNNIYIIKLNLSTKSDPGPIANSGGTGLGANGNTSFAISSGGFQGTTSVEKACGGTVDTIATNLTTDGDFCIDYNLGLLWYKSSSATLTVTYSFKYATWFGWGLESSNNATGSTMLVDNSTFEYCGWRSLSATENSGACLRADDKYSPTLDSARAVRFTGNTFTHAIRPIQLYNTNTDTVATNSTNKIFITSNVFNYSHFEDQNFLHGVIQLGYSRYVDIGSNTFKGYAMMFGNPGRGTSIGVDVHDNTGGETLNFTLPSTAVASKFRLNTMTAWAGTEDIANFHVPGDVTNGANQYTDNVIGYGHRAARLDNNMTVTGNRWYRTYHHGVVERSSDGFINNFTFTNNIVQDSSIPVGADFAGGWTLGYNRNQWVDNVSIQHNTFDRGLRCINFNDEENTVVLGTRIKILDNICSNSVQGIYQPAGNSSNVSKLALWRNDYNNDYNNTTTPTNVAQATFMRSSAEYNGGTRNIAGVYIFGPSGYALPDATSRSLVETITGTSGTNKSITLAWSGGTAVDLVQNQRTATGGTTTSLTDTGASFTTTGAGLKGFQLMIVGGTGSGQQAMIISNTATSLTLVAPTTSGALANAPNNTSVYLVIKSQVTLADSGGVNTVQAGTYTPSLSTTNATNTDSGITIDVHSFNVDPLYVNASGGDLRPQNAALDGTASDAGDVGALSVLLGGNAAPRRSHRRK